MAALPGLCLSPGHSFKKIKGMIVLTAELFITSRIHDQFHTFPSFANPPARDESFLARRSHHLSLHRLKKRFSG